MQLDAYADKGLTLSGIILPQQADQPYVVRLQDGLDHLLQVFVKSVYRASDGRSLWRVEQILNTNSLK
ncbi:MAG: hypothetical protein V7L29_00780 [Nostoc sp.]|uniref:hypothetical protein n=1 Tax=Nostoc sp. TaxID=1180 RepID=UPI002FF06EF5